MSEPKSAGRKSSVFESGDYRPPSLPVRAWATAAVTGHDVGANQVVAPRQPAYPEKGLGEGDPPGFTFSNRRFQATVVPAFTILYS